MSADAIGADLGLLLFEHGSTRALRLDTEGNIQQVSRALADALGSRRESLVGHPVGSLLHPAHPPCSRALGDLVRGSRPLELAMGIGEPLWTTWRAHPLPPGVLLIADEGSSRSVAAHEALEPLASGLTGDGRPLLLETRLRPAQREQTLGRLAGSMAHEFNNLLTVISAHSDLLEEQLESRSALEDIAAIKQAASQGSGMTARLLSFTRRQIHQPENIRVSLFLRELEPVLRTFAGARRTVAFDVEPSLGWVKLDPALFEQVLLSLVDNAVRATDPGGVIVVGASLTETEQVQLEVVDDGRGMDAVERRRACEEFFTTRPSGQGTGLGLTTALAVVREVGGELAIGSARGRGTRVRITLPPVEAPSGSYSLEPTPVAEETVLLVEDQFGVRRAARRILRRAGYKVFEAAHAEDALALLASYEGPLDLLLTDVVMPGASGPQLAERLLQERPELPVLYMSGYAEDVHEVRRALSRGQHFLAKPFTPEQLLRRVRVAVDGEEEELERQSS